MEQEEYADFRIRDDMMEENLDALVQVGRICNGHAGKYAHSGTIRDQDDY